ncbi:hypothetical protein D3C72_1702170 [compost metagenome]
MAASVVTNPNMVAMFGWIIPDPFAAPAIFTSRSSITRETQTSFLTKSVVRIAWENCSAPSSSALMTVGSPAIPLVTRSIFISSPITPVEATATSEGVTPSTLAASARIVYASASPCLPVQAFALPLFTTTARRVRLAARLS